MQSLKCALFGVVLTGWSAQVAQAGPTEVFTAFCQGQSEQAFQLIWQEASDVEQAFLKQPMYAAQMIQCALEQQSEWRLNQLKRLEMLNTPTAQAAVADVLDLEQLCNDEFVSAFQILFPQVKTQLQTRVTALAAQPVRNRNRGFAIIEYWAKPDCLRAQQVVNNQGSCSLPPKFLRQLQSLAPQS